MASIKKKSRKHLYGRLTENLEDNTDKINTIQSTKLYHDKKILNQLHIIYSDNYIFDSTSDNSISIDVYRPLRVYPNQKNFNKKIQNNNKNYHRVHPKKKIKKIYSGSKTSRPGKYVGRKLSKFRNKIISCDMDRNLPTKSKRHNFF